MSLILDGTNGEILPSWTTATRPASPAVGQMGYNTTTGNFDAYTAAGWTSIVSSTTAQGSTSGSVIANGPAFSAYQSFTQTITGATYTKVQVNTKVFDTASCYDATTNYRFTPTVAGYYQVNGYVRMNATGSTQIIPAIFKNGAEYVRGTDLSFATSTVNSFQALVCELVFLNGSTDYIELYGYITGAGANFTFANTAATSRFSASLARTA